METEINNEEIDSKIKWRKTNTTKKVALTAVLIPVGLILSYLNPFAYIPIFDIKINPFVHLVNALSGVLIGVIFSCITALGIAILRYSFAIGSIHAFHGGVSGALIVGIFSYIFHKINPKYINFAALTEPIGTVFIGGTIAHFIVPLGPLSESLFFYWGLFAASSIPGCFLGYGLLQILKRYGITSEDFTR